MESIKAADIINQRTNKIKQELKSRFQSKSKSKKKEIKNKFGSGKDFVNAQSVLTVA